MQELVVENPLLWLVIAFVLGIVVWWVIDLLLLRRPVQKRLAQLSTTVKQRDADLQRAQATLAQNNAASETQLNDLREQLTMCMGNLDMAVKKSQQLDSAYTSRASEMNDLRMRITSLTTEREKLRADYAALQNDAEKNRSTPASSELAESTKFAAEAAATNAALKALENTRNELTGQVQALNDQLNAQHERVTALQELVDAAALERATLESALADVNAHAAAVQKELDQVAPERSALLDDVGKLSAGTLAAAELIKTLEGDKAALTDKFTRAQTALERLTREKALADAELAQIKLQLTKLDTALGITARDKTQYAETLAARVTELTDAQTQLIQVKQDNTSLLGDIAKFTARTASAATQVLALEQDKRGLAAQVDALQTQLANLQVRGKIETRYVRSPEAAETGRNAAQQLAVAEETPTTTSDTVVSEPPAPTPAITDSTASENAAPAPEPQSFQTICPQDLSQVQGVSPEFEQRLYNAEIGTYWHLSQLDEAQLAHILELDQAQLSVNLTEMRADALRLARLSQTQGRTWQGGEPDDFDRLIGTGRVYEKRLYDAGICTFEGLAALTAEQLAQICHAPDLAEAEYQSWIDQAKSFAENRK